MAKMSKKITATAAKTKISESSNKKLGTAGKRTRKSVPRDSPPKRSSVFRGVTRHRWTGRYEAHLWDKNSWNDSQNKKGRQVYLGAYDEEEAAAHAYDLAALKYWGPLTILNFPLETYDKETKEMEGQSKEEYIGSLRRKSSGFSRGVSKYRGVARHHHNGRWEARIGRVFGNKYLYLGTYATQEEAATAYDMAAIEYRGLNAVTNFDLSRYIHCFRPNGTTQTPTTSNGDTTTTPVDHDDIHSPFQNDAVVDLNHSQLVAASPSPTHFFNQIPSPAGSTTPSSGLISGGSSSSSSSALGLLLQSSKFKEMLERTSRSTATTTDSRTSTPTPTPEVSDHQLPRRSFPEDIQTYFDCQDSGGSYAGEEILFGNLNDFVSPIFHCELDG
ncbi:AP2-like ethylene-responsive transcription factor At1g16060 [Linum grandiflorum]